MTNKKTLIILTPGFPDSEADTTCLPMLQYFVRTVKEISPELDTVVLTFQYPYRQNPYEWFGIKVTPFGGKNKGGLPKLRLRQKINSTLKKIHRTKKIIGLFSFWYNECALIGKKFGDRYSIRHYCWILGQDAKSENSYPRLLRPQEKDLIALSDFLQDEFEKNHRIRPQFVIPPGIDAKLYNSLPQKRDIDLFGAGSLIALKQYDIFLEVLGEIKKQMPGINAIIAGKGPERRRLESLVEKLELQKNVSLVGELPYGEVLQLMQRSKVFLHTSSYEGFPGVCLEALFAGCHIVSFCQPMKTGINHWQVVKTGQEMIKETLRLLQKQTEYKAVSVYSMHDSAKKIIHLFEEG